VGVRAAVLSVGSEGWHREDFIGTNKREQGRSSSDISERRALQAEGTASAKVFRLEQA
jgi:hypothetical protein